VGCYSARGAFYGMGGNGGGGEAAGGGGFLIPIGFDIELGRGVDEVPSQCRRVKAAGRHFGSAPSECGRAANDGARCGGATGGQRRPR
jgi:hypothetical protein